MHKRALAATVGLACMLGTVALAADPSTKASNDWPQYNRTANAWRYSSLDQINKDNVGKLSVAPLTIDGVIYSVTSGDKVAALDGKTGREIWRYEPKLRALTKKVLFSPYGRGVAVGNGLVFIGTADGRGIALDQTTGREKWQVQLADFVNCHGCNFTSPVVASGMLAFRSTAGELATQRRLSGVEAATGNKAWELNTIKQDEKSWLIESGKYAGGGAWMLGTYDADTISWGTGIPIPMILAGWLWLPTVANPAGWMPMIQLRASASGHTRGKSPASPAF